MTVRELALLGVLAAICVGFGVSGPEQVSALKKLGVEGFVVGSGIVRRLDDGLESMQAFVASLKGAC